MGDRRNIVVEFSDTNSVALYTHWTGTGLGKTLKFGLTAGKHRWDDPTYLTRIIFSRMIERSLLEETGYGIEPFTTGSSMYCEASPGYDFLVKPETKTVEVNGKTFTFAEFCDLSNKQAEEL